MSAGESRVPPTWAKARAFPPSPKFVALSHLRRLRGCEQVAAVCYRMRGADIELLLVQTRGGRWTFPKGSAEPGLTNAQAAALEAFEEAGVHEHHPVLRSGDARVEGERRALLLVHDPDLECAGLEPERLLDGREQLDGEGHLVELWEPPAAP